MSKFQIVKGAANNLADTPYVEGKVYFVYTDAESEDLDIYADIDGVRRKIKEGIQEEALSNFLLKTDIAEWAKAESKPTYTAAEVGALPSNTSIVQDLQYNTTQKSIRMDKNGTMQDLITIDTLKTELEVPTKTSDLTNDSGYLTSYTETDPTVPSWAKAETKPTYTYDEIGAAASSHAHGSITNVGAITSNTALANGDRLVFSDNSDSNLLKRSSITLGTSTTQYFANNGTWQNIPTISVSQTLTTGTEIGKVNGTSLYAPNSYDDTSLSARVTALENLEWATYYSGRQNPSDSQGNNGDIYLQY